MPFSRNPRTGRIEAYTDNGFLTGFISTMGDFITNNTAQDGGPGSGNFGHSGRPGQVGGSGPGGGTEKSNPDQTGGTELKEPVTRWEGNKPQKSGIELAKKLAKEYEKAPRAPDWNEPSVRSKDDLVHSIYDYLGYGNEITDEIKKNMYDHYLKVVEVNGDPSKTNKETLYGYRTIDSQNDLLTLSPDQNKKMESALRAYTGDDWKSADQETLEEYIEQCPVAFKNSLFRGIHVKKEEAEGILDQLKSGVVSFGKVTSWSSKRVTAHAFATNDDDNNVIGDDEVPFVFYIPANNNRSAAPVKQFSHYKEDESIMSGKCSYSVVAIEKQNFLTGKYGEKSSVEGYIAVMIERGEEYDEP